MEKNTPLAQGHSFEPSSFTQFLWWLATAEKELITDSVVDRNRYRIIGMSVLATWIFATLSWCYFFSTFTESGFMYVPLGAFMGFVILCIDRALIKGINKFNKKKWMSLLFRGMLAITIGTFMAQPVVLFMFDKEITMQASLDNEKRKQTKRTELEKLYAGRKTELQKQQSEITSQLVLSENKVADARKEFLAETDGSGGTGKVGIAKIALAKKAEYEKLDAAYKEMQNLEQPKLAAIEKELATIEAGMGTEQTAFTQYLKNGFLTRSEALVNLLKGSTALQWRYFLIVAILMLIELMPVIAKMLIPTGSYDEKVYLRDQLEKDMAAFNTQKEKELKELYNRLAFESNSKTIEVFFAQKQEDNRQKITELSHNWKKNEHQEIDSYWERMKKDVLMKMEN